jgi:hypothetical protein
MSATCKDQTTKVGSHSCWKGMQTPKQAIRQPLMCEGMLQRNIYREAIEGALYMLVGGGLQGVQLPAQFMQRLPALLQLRQPLLPGEHALQGGTCTPSSSFAMQQANHRRLAANPVHISSSRQLDSPSRACSQLFPGTKPPAHPQHHGVRSPWDMRDLQHG